MTRAVFFDVDFTLIYPGPTFQGAGHQNFCAQYGINVDPATFDRAVASAGMKIGLISNTQRCLSSFERHFELEGLFSVALSSYEHGYMKPHPSIFEAALRAAGAPAEEAVMVGDSYAHDIEGARRTGMRAVLVSRAGRAESLPEDTPVISSLRALPSLL